MSAVLLGPAAGSASFSAWTHTDGHDTARSPLEEIASNSWRSMQAGRQAPRQAQQRAVRGSVFWGVDVKVWVWLAAHTFVPVILYSLGAEFQQMVLTAQRVDVGVEREHILMVTYITLQLVVLWLFFKTYASDPGTITAEQPGPGVQYLRCQWCASSSSDVSQRPLRSYHCRTTDRCVHKLDHFCWWLSTSIGDLNHARFIAFVACELALLLWLVQQLLPLLRFCLFSPAAADVVNSLGSSSNSSSRRGHKDISGSYGGSTARWTCNAMGSPLAKVVLVTLVLLDAACSLFMANLLLLQMYLAASGQTTLELLKGAGVRYLQPAYSQFPGPRAWTTLTLPNYINRLIKGTLPPAPFSHVPPASHSLIASHSLVAPHSLVASQSDAAPQLAVGPQADVSCHTAYGCGRVIGCKRAAAVVRGVMCNLYIFFLAPKPYNYTYQPPYLLDALEPQHEHGPLGDGLSGPELDRLGHPDRIRGPETQRQGVSLHAPLLYKHQGFQDYPVVATHTVRGGVHAMHADAGEDAGWHGRGKSGTS